MTRRWSVAPEVSEPRLLSAIGAPITARWSRTLRSSRYTCTCRAGPTRSRRPSTCRPRSEGRSSRRCRVARSVVAVVVRVTEARSSEPWLIRSTLRWIVSPGRVRSRRRSGGWSRTGGAERDRDGPGCDRMVGGRRAREGRKRAETGDAGGRAEDGCSGQELPAARARPGQTGLSVRGAGLAKAFESFRSADHSIGREAA